MDNKNEEEDRERECMCIKRAGEHEALSNREVMSLGAQHKLLVRI